MLVRSEKIATTEIDNPCPSCDGAGSNLIVPYGIEPPFSMICSNCHGEKTVTASLLKRKDRGKTLRHVLKEKGLILREAAERYGGSIQSWADAVAGRAGLEEIEAKLRLFDE